MIDRVRRRLPPIDRLSWRLGLSISVTVVCGLLAGFVLVYHVSHRQLVRIAREHALQETSLVAEALSAQMLNKDTALLRNMVESFVRDRPFQRVMVLDRQGKVRISSDPEIRERHFSFASPTCQECHSRPAAERDRSIMLAVDGGDLLRCVQPIPNAEPCHACHSPEHQINGMVVVDVSLTPTLQALERSVGGLALGTCAIGLLLLGGIGYAFRSLVLRRLLRFESAARALARGDLDRRVSVEGNDALTRVEEQFNEMADSLGAVLTQLREQRASMERVMNSVDDGMVVLDRSRRIVAANDAFLRRFPSGEGGIAGAPCCGSGPDGLCGRNGEAGECPTVSCFETRQPYVCIRTRTASDGTARQEEILASPVISDHGTVTHVVEVWRDITERRSAEARLAEYQRMVSLGMLASGFSHEVNTPLASIGACLDGIRRLCGGEGPLPAEDLSAVTEYAAIASTQVQRCGAITQQFLQLARGRSLQRDVVDLEVCAGMTARLCRHKAGELGVGIDVASGRGTGSVIANGAAVQQVLLNLLLNAIEASGPGKRVSIDFVSGDAPAVLIRDEGSGIGSDDLGRIFEPFFSRKEKGTGLGLFVSLNLARSWGGDIRVESAPGEGTTMTVLFPRAQGGSEKADEPGQSAARG